MNNNFAKKPVNIDDDHFTSLLSPRPFSRQDFQPSRAPNLANTLDADPSRDGIDNYRSLPRGFFDDDDVNVTMSHRHNQHPPFYPAARFGSMDRLRSNNNNSSRLSDESSSTKLPRDTMSNDNSRLFNQKQRHFPSSQQLHSHSSFFDDPMDDFERKFFERRAADFDKMSTPPRMPEWGFSGMPSTLDGQFSRDAPFSASERNFANKGGSSGSDTPGERVIPIQVEGRRGDKKPAPPYKPPELGKNFNGAPSGSGREIPIQRENLNPIKSNHVLHKTPELPEQHFSKAASTTPNKPIQIQNTAPPPTMAPFEPDVFLQKLGEAPKLSDRLAGKITRFDEFSDVLSQLPKQPNRPSADRELDEKLAPFIGKLKLNDDDSPITATPNVPQPVNPTNSSKFCAEEQNIKLTAEAAPEAPQIVRLFDDALKATLNEFVAAGGKIGAEVGEITVLAKEAVEALRSFLWNAVCIKKPDDNALSSLLKPISDKIEAIQAFTGARRASSYFNHLSMISESIAALGWVTISPTPAPYIKEMVDAAQFYVNRVLKDYKDKDKIHTDWAKLWPKLLTDMQLYVKQNHTTGLVWNSSPGVKPPSAPAAAAPAKPKGPPGPPPPPPPTFLQDAQRGAQDDADSRAALFADINKGLDITKSLKKVTDDLKMHKNPTLRQTALVTETEKSSPQTTVNKPSSTTPTQHQPKIELEGGKKWVIEYVTNDKNVVVNVADMKQVAYIYKCNNAVIHFKGKINSITMDGCKSTSIVFGDVVAAVDIINCQRSQIQSMGKMPTLAVQKTDGCQIYLCKESLNAEIISSKSSEMNVLVPNANGEYDEHALPEQYKTVWNGQKLQTAVVDIA